MGATIAFFPVVLNTIAGLELRRSAYVTAARSMGASSAADVLERDVAGGISGASSPVCAWASSSAFLSILGTETIASFSGLGHRIVELGENMDTAKMFAYIVFVMLIAVLLNARFRSPEARARRR